MKNWGRKNFCQGCAGLEPLPTNFAAVTFETTFLQRRCGAFSLSADFVSWIPARADGGAVATARRSANDVALLWRCFAVDDGAGWLAPVVRDDDVRRLRCWMTCCRREGWHH